MSIAEIDPGAFRYEVQVVIDDEKRIYYTNEIDFDVHGFVKIIPSLVVSINNRWEPKGVEIMLPHHSVGIITEHKGPR